MNLDFSNKTDIFTLDDVPRGFLQVLLPEFTLTKVGDDNRARLLEIFLKENLHAIVSSAGKKQFFELVRKSSAAEKQLRQELKAFQKDSSIISYRLDCGSHPLRYGNGGVLPVIRWKRDGHEVVEYFCLFYRDIFPIGWNIANGASDNLEEMKNPELILLREFGEELLIRDDEKRIVYTFDPGRDTDPGDSPSKARKAWESRHPHTAEYATLSVPMTWIKGPDRVRVRWAGGSKESEGYFLNIVPDDNAIEVDRAALINVTGGVSFFDGEQSRGVTLNRAVGLFRVDRFSRRDALDGHEFAPDLVFVDGVRGAPAKILEVAEAKLQELAKMPSPFRTEEDRKAWQACDRKLDLCPITRQMIRRYLDKIQDVPKAPKSRMPETRQDPEHCQVFISYRSTDEGVARGLYAHLSASGIRPFLSAVSLPFLGESDYAAAIDRALESANCLVVLGTRPECFDSGWVGYEWRSFLNEIRSGRKPGCQLLSLVSGVKIEELPFALRSYQVIPFSPSSPQDAFENVACYLKPSLRKVDLTVNSSAPPGSAS